MHHILTPYENYAFLRDALGYILLCIHLFCILVDLSLPLDTLSVRITSQRIWIIIQGPH